MPPAVLRAAVSVMVLGIAGCGFGEGDDGAATTLPPVATPPSSTVPQGSTYTADQLGPALPAQSELPAGFEPRCWCATDPFPACTVQRDSTEAFVQYQHGTGFATTTLNVTATAHDDGIDTFEDIAERRANAEASSGVIDESIEPQGEAVYTPGREGVSTVDDANLAGWDGFREAATYDAIDEFSGRHATHFERLVVAAGNVVVDVELTVGTAA